MKKPYFSYEQLSGGSHRVTFLDHETGEYLSNPLEQPMALHKVKQRVKKLISTYRIKVREDL